MVCLTMERGETDGDIRETGLGNDKKSRMDELKPKQVKGLMKSLKVRNALVRECMAEFLGTFVLLVSGKWLYEF